MIEILPIVSFLLIYVISIIVVNNWGYRLEQFNLLRYRKQLDIKELNEITDEKLYNEKLVEIHDKLSKKAHKRLWIGVLLLILDVIVFMLLSWFNADDYFIAFIILLCIFVIPGIMGFLVSYRMKIGFKISIVLILIGIFLTYDGYSDVVIFADIGKPVIYLYGYEGDVSVSLNPSDKIDITVDYPKFNSEYKWNIKCDKDGHFVDMNGKDHRYLFYEAERCDKVELQDGFCIKGSDTVEFLESVLPKLGLNDYEMEDFITYWYPKMMNNRYNVIRFVPQFEYDELIGLDVNPKPDNAIRIYMTWYGSDKYVDIEEQDIVDRSSDRSGRYVVEWGGTEIYK